MGAEIHQTLAWGARRIDTPDTSDRPRQLTTKRSPEVQGVTPPMPKTLKTKTRRTHWRVYTQFHVSGARRDTHIRRSQIHTPAHDPDNSRRSSQASDYVHGDCKWDNVAWGDHGAALTNSSECFTSTLWAVRLVFSCAFRVAPAIYSTSHLWRIRCIQSSCASKECHMGNNFYVLRPP